MATETDERGRLYLNRALRERYGERFHVVEYHDRIELIPVDDDPLDGLREAIGDALGDRSIEELRDIASEEGRRQAGEHVR